MDFSQDQLLEVNGSSWAGRRCHGENGAFVALRALLLLLCWRTLRCAPAFFLFLLLCWCSLRCAPARGSFLLLCWCSLCCAPALVPFYLLCWRSLRCAPAVGQGLTKWVYVLRPRVAGVCFWCASTPAQIPLWAHRLCTAANPGLRPHTHFASPKIFL